LYAVVDLDAPRLLDARHDPEQALDTAPLLERGEPLCVGVGRRDARLDLLFGREPLDIWVRGRANFRRKSPERSATPPPTTELAGTGAGGNADASCRGYRLPWSAPQSNHIEGHPR
jgi:hypothetical protein